MQAIYGYIDPVNGQNSSWSNQGNHEWVCEYAPTHRHGCGWDVYWDPNYVNGIDFSRYNAVEISLKYEGTASRIRVYMRNYNPAYATPNDASSNKFLAMNFRLSEIEKPVVIKLSEFSVASWWLRERNIRRRWSLPEFDNITKIGVDFIEKGSHKTQVESIVLIGSWIRTETLLSSILAFWMSVFLLEGIVRFYQLYKKSQYSRLRIQELRDKQHQLEKEKENLRELADTDPLTGIRNRTGITAHINSLFADPNTAPNFGLMLLDIDHFKVLNDTHGHDLGDAVLKAFAATMSLNLRSEDTFARWGGEEFIVISHQNSARVLFDLAEKLRKITANYKFGANHDLNITISIGLSSARKGDNFENLFKRADTALYRAKQNGRNRVEFET